MFYPKSADVQESSKMSFCQWKEWGHFTSSIFIAVYLRVSVQSKCSLCRPAISRALWGLYWSVFVSYPQNKNKIKMTYKMLPIFAKKKCHNEWMRPLSQAYTVQAAMPLSPYSTVCELWINVWAYIQIYFIFLKLPHHCETSYICRY